MHSDYEGYESGSLTLQSGMTLRNPGWPTKSRDGNEERSNAILYPTWYSGRHWDNEWLIGEEMSLDPAQYFIIVPDMFGNGLSSSPSNILDGPRFPNILSGPYFERCASKLTAAPSKHRRAALERLSPTFTPDSYNLP